MKWNEVHPEFYWIQLYWLKAVTSNISKARYALEPYFAEIAAEPQSVSHFPNASQSVFTFSKWTRISECHIVLRLGLLFDYLSQMMQVLYHKSEQRDTTTVLPVSSVRIWDVRPFAPQERCVKIFQGNQHTYEKVQAFVYGYGSLIR